MARYSETKHNFELRPVNVVAGSRTAVTKGWSEIGRTLANEAGTADRNVVAVECYPGVDVARVMAELCAPLAADACIDVEEAARDKPDIEQMLETYVTDDRVFGRYYAGPLGDFYDTQRLAEMRSRIDSETGIVLVVGHGATLVCDPDILVYADMTRWEVEQRQRRGMPNWLTDNDDEEPLRKFKRGYFIEWRVADRHKAALLPRIDYLLETVNSDQPKLVEGRVFRDSLSELCRRPFRVVPCFDPGVWGGQWLREVCGLPDGPPNYAWSFDCIIEANSLLIGLEDTVIEVPAIDLVLHDPVAILGQRVFERFGAEFPIRFNFLDTMDGGNLSLQVHPLPEYLHDVFGFPYPQDESYYVMAAETDGVVYLGVKTGARRDTMVPALREAQNGGAPFDDQQYVNRWPARKHDHFLIPAGTVHCSGRNTVVLEISSTPYIFTFKLWDWGRLGMDGLPRPVHINHGEHSIRFERDTDWTQRELINRFEGMGTGRDWREEKTGLHELEFIETRRHWFASEVEHDTRGDSVQVVNLCEGTQVAVESPSDSFPPLEVHYAETFIVPAAVGPYRVRKNDSHAGDLATIKAFVRT